MVVNQALDGTGRFRSGAMFEDLKNKVAIVESYQFPWARG